MQTTPAPKQKATDEQTAKKRQQNRQRVAKWRSLDKKKWENLKQARVTVYACFLERFIDIAIYVTDKEMTLDYRGPNVCEENNRLLATSGDYE